MTLALRSLLARIPGIAWVILLTASLAGAGLACVYARGRRAGAAAVHRAALADSARLAHADVAAAAVRTDSSVVLATRWRAKAGAARKRYETHRAAIAPALDSLPPAVLSTLYAADTAIAQLDTVIQVQATALEAYAIERAARIAADSVEAHQIQLRPPDAGVSWRALVTGGAVVVTGVLLLVGLAR